MVLRLARGIAPCEHDETVKVAVGLRGPTQEALSHEAGITTGTLSLIERGQSNPAWGTVSRLADALGTSMGRARKTGRPSPALSLESRSP